MLEMSLTRISIFCISSPSVDHKGVLELDSYHLFTQKDGKIS